MIDRLSSPFPCITYPLKLIHHRTLIKHPIETPIYFIYLVFQLIIKNMDPYEPFYYPYNPLFPATLTLSDRLRELQKQEDYKKRIQADLIMQQNEQALARSDYTRSLLINEQIQHDLYRTYYDHERNKQMAQVAETAIEYDYLKKIDELRRQRELLSNPDQFASLSFPNQQKVMSDDQLIRLYESGGRDKEYKKQLMATLNKRQSDSKGNYSSAVNPRYNKYVESQQQKEMSEQELAKRSYVEGFNNSTVNENENSAFKRSRNDFNKGNTIDVFARTSSDSPFKNGHQSSSRGGKLNKKNNKKFNQSLTMDKNQKRQYLKVRKDEPSSFIIESAMKKISNRLKVSKIVYKDSKLRHNKHEADHLFSTFQKEMKIRKEVKDKINNHPDILKKHDLVVSSR